MNTGHATRAILTHSRVSRNIAQSRSCMLMSRHKSSIDSLYSSFSNSSHDLTNIVMTTSSNLNQNSSETLHESTMDNRRIDRSISKVITASIENDVEGVNTFESTLNRVLEMQKLGKDESERSELDLNEVLGLPVNQNGLDVNKMIDHVDSGSL